jgi:hypothetical protein
VHLLVVAVGKVQERGLREVIDDCLTRIRRHVPCDEPRDGKDVEASLRAAIPSGAIGTVASERRQAQRAWELMREAAG